MDGNGRWARKRAMPRTMGHAYGVKAVKKAVTYAAEHNIEVLTLFAMSTENMMCRPPSEIKSLLSLFAKQLRVQVQELHEQGVRLSFIGDSSVLSAELQTLMAESVKLTCGNSRLRVVIAINYSGKWDIANAVSSIANKVSMGEINVVDINESLVEGFMSLHDLPEPDLLIRTGGDTRISNFLLWQLAYAELFFTDILWPDFNADIFEQALLEYSSRLRKFGRTKEQVEKGDA